MNIHNPGNLALLDRVRLAGGTGELENFFKSVAKNNLDRAVSLINDESLHFCSLYALEREAGRPDLYARLNPRNRSALDIIRIISKKRAGNYRRPFTDCRNMPYAVLRWIIATGCRDDGYSSRYDEIMELTAALLTRVYRDKTILPAITGMIFNRNRRDRLIHDLVWALFECRETSCLDMIACRLCSPYRKDVELARKLLWFVPCISGRSTDEGAGQYLYFLQWYRENCLYMYYTGESFQMTANPMPYAISLEAEYLCKPVSPEDGKTINPLTKEERRLLETFNGLDEGTRAKLSSFSVSLNRQNTPQWNRWLHSPVGEQVRAAGLATEV
jgi:hypothetical protein